MAQESALEGAHRTAHQRLITNSEEIAFYGGAMRERTLIEKSLQELYQFAKKHRNIRALVGVFDQLLIKYWATIAGYFVMWVPIILNVGGEKSVADLTRDYARISRYLENLSNAVGQLVLVINKLATISGHTKRVSELLEIVDDLITKPVTPFKRRDEQKRDGRRTNPYLEGIDEVCLPAYLAACCSPSLTLVLDVSIVVARVEAPCRCRAPAPPVAPPSRHATGEIGRAHV